MAVGTLAPAYLQLLYRTAYAPHIMTLPVKGWTAGTGLGDFDAWNGGSNPAVDYIDDYLALIAPFFLPTTNFYGANIFTKADADSPSVLAAAVALDVDGSSTDTGISKAVQVTWIFSSPDGKLFKNVFLDVPNGDSFEAITLSGLSAAAIAYINFVKADDTSFSCRQDARPGIFRRATVTLNAELQRQYYMN